MKHTKLQDLTNYSDNELSLQVFNTQELYNVRTLDSILLLFFLRKRFKFTGNQWTVLYNDIKLDSREQ